jgi:alpha-1,3-rhamnosyl/mannosyltransferase
MKALRIALSTTVIQPHLYVGLDGIGIYTTHLLQNLPEQGFDVTPVYFAPAIPKQISNAAPIGKQLPYSYPIQALVGRFPGGGLSLGCEVDLFHATDYRVVRADVPVVATLHDAVPLKYPEWTTPRLRSVKNWFLRNGSRHADQVIALSHYAIAELVEFYGVHPDKINVVPCGVDDMWLTPPALSAVEALLSAYGIAPGYFLFVGTLQPRKNVKTLVEAYRALPESIRAEHALVIVGRAGWRCDGDVEAIHMAQSAGLSVYWFDDIRGQESLRQLYAGAGAFVFPTLYEGFGIPMLEAFASGIPVVASNVTSVPEVAGDAAVLIEPTDVSAMSDAMRMIVTDGALRNQCIERGKVRARYYSWRRTAEMTAAVYRKVL